MSVNFIEIEFESAIFQIKKQCLRFLINFFYEEVFEFERGIIDFFCRK
jgi:hypothetical protein